MKGSDYKTPPTERRVVGLINRQHMHRAEQSRKKPEPCSCPEQRFPAPGESSSDVDPADCLVTVLRYDPSGKDSLSHTDLDWLWLSSLHMASLRIDSSFIYLLQGVCPLDMFRKWHVLVPTLRPLCKTTIAGDRELPSHRLPPCCGQQVKSCWGWTSVFLTDLLLLKTYGFPSH